MNSRARPSHASVVACVAWTRPPDPDPCWIVVAVRSDRAGFWAADAGRAGAERVEDRRLARIDREHPRGGHDIQLVVVAATDGGDPAMLGVDHSVRRAPRTLFAGTTARARDQIGQRQRNVPHLDAIDRPEPGLVARPCVVRQVHARGPRTGDVRRDRERMVDADERAGGVRGREEVIVPWPHRGPRGSMARSDSTRAASTATSTRRSGG